MTLELYPDGSRNGQVADSTGHRVWYQIAHFNMKVPTKFYTPGDGNRGEVRYNVSLDRMKDRFSRIAEVKMAEKNEAMNWLLGEWKTRWWVNAVYSGLPGYVDGNWVKTWHPGQLNPANMLATIPGMSITVGKPISERVTISLNRRKLCPAI